MEKYKYKLTVSRVFLFVCVVVILLLSYLLVIEHDKVKLFDNKEKSVFSEKEALEIATNLYTGAYNYVYSSMFIENANLNYSCMEVNTIDLNNYFTSRVVNDFCSSLETDGQIYYDCGNVYHALDLTSIFGNTDQGIRKLNIESFSENLIIAKGSLENTTEKDRYIVFVKENNEWLIDMYE